MAIMQRVMVITLLHALIGVCGAALASPRLKPTLEPRSSKKFFGQDYPVDHAPGATSYYNFDHPYPAVQDTDAYNTDFVKDQNTDNGQWQAQADYDALRNKLRQLEKVLDDMRNTMDKERAGMDNAKETWQDSVNREKALEVRRKKAETAVAEAQREVDEITAKKEGAASKVVDETADMKECKKTLEDAKDRLRELLEKQEELEMKAKDAADAHRKKLQDEAQREADRKRRKALAKEAARKREEEMLRRMARSKTEEEKQLARRKQLIQDELTRIEKRETHWKARIAEEKKEYGVASGEYESIAEELKGNDQELNEAAEKLRKYRRPPHVDDNGGVYNVPDEKQARTKSSAASWSLSVLFGFAIGAAVMC